MVGWIVLGVCVGSLLVFALVVTRTMGGLRQFRRAVRRAQLGQEANVTRTRSKVAEMQTALGLVALRATRTSEQLAMIKAARADDRMAVTDRD